MAVTRIWAIKGVRLDKVIDYVVNTSKTDENNISDERLSDLYRTLHYVTDEKKTTDLTEKRIFVTGVNCIPENAKQEMTDTKKRFNQEGGILAHHAYQSFKPGEVTPEQAHKIGVELAKKMWGDRFEVIVATHMNTNALHNHILVNSTSFVDGKKYNGCKETYRRMRDISDGLCREYGLSVIENPGKKGRENYAAYTARKNGELTKNVIIRKDIDDAILQCITQKQFFHLMENMGYSFRRGKKYVYLFHPMIPKGLRLDHLGGGYDYNEIVGRISAKSKRYILPFPEQDDMETFLNLPGLHDDDRTVYVHFVAILGNVKERPAENLALRRLLWDDLIKFDRRVEEQNLILDNDLYSTDDVLKFRDQCERELADCEDARRILRNDLRRAERAGNTEEIAALHSDISTLTNAMSRLRKKIRICDRITQTVSTLEDKFRNIADCAERQKTEKKKSITKGIVR